MTEPLVTIRLADRRRAWQPGELLEGTYRIDRADLAEIKAVELSVLWYTEGKGDEDLGVHYFQRVALEEGQSLDLGLPQAFGTRLPNSPLSYDGRIVKIRWCVRVRVFLHRGKPLVCEEPFQLGSVPRVPVEVVEK
jgi:hypothetical protein